ncbi:unnamed protein product [Durusdinium trenchii]|uniref:Protein kinase domain-containing protein n=1 Tax=Durusdinium trenchii TaxID=1381693 RepID=A0ABP0SUZ9_9DINO
MPRILAAATVLLLPRLLRRTLLTWGPLALSRAAQASDLVTLPEVARCNGLQLRPQRLIGGGAQGSVFLTQAGAAHVLPEVSRPSTGASVSRECAILQRLQDVPNIVRCVEDCVVEGRRSSLLWPYFAAPGTRNPRRRFQVDHQRGVLAADCGAVAEERGGGCRCSGASEEQRRVAVD